MNEQTGVENGVQEKGQGGSPEVNWRDSLSEDWRDKYTEFKTQDDVFKSYDSLVKRMGAPDSYIKKPGKDATEEQIAEYRQSIQKELGVPDSKDAYVYATPENMPEGFLNNDLMEGLKEVALQNGVSAEAFTALASTYLEQQLGMYNGVLEANKQVEEALKEKWGNDFERNKTAAMNFAEMNLPKEIIERYAGEPEFLQMMHSLNGKYNQDKSMQLPDGNISSADTAEDLRNQARDIEREASNLGPSEHSKRAELRNKATELYKRMAEIQAAG